MPAKEAIEKLFEDFNRKKVLIIGDVMIDAYLWGQVERISPEAPVPIVSVNKRENRLGGAANVALNIKSLGAEPILCSVIGNDNKAEEFIQLLKQDGLTSRGLIKSDDRITTTKFRVIGNKMQMLRVDEEVTGDLSDNDIRVIFGKIENMLEHENIACVIFQDYNKGVLTTGLIHEVIKKANKRNIPVVVDPKKKNFEAYQNVSLFKPNLKELKEGLNVDVDPDNLNEMANAVQLLHKNQRIHTVMCTLSDQGVFISYQSSENKIEYEHIPAHIRSISDVSGAGDTVVSVAALGYVMGLAPTLLAGISNLAGGIVCEEAGVVPINKEKLLRESIKIYATD
ncbi:MAG: PfkB family carbohydrate kinase [Bacteroidota bacterium]|nr:PfkB family carbohydrate kinase [Bacteroidota bacterium]